ncbi:fructose-bisphosphatase class II [Nocardia tengchongensis]|uniref:fructose-bisphosphatase class II n=1 Tax=Nocardia tengchongensis TaxID=2055889 RepID=UPI003677E2FF
MTEHNPHGPHDKYAATASRAAATAVAATYPYIGLGPQVKALIDTAATDAIAATLVNAMQEGLEPITVASCEGARDGAPPLVLPATASIDGMRLVCDPIDGTLNAARGGPRAVSVVAFTQMHSPPTYLDDKQSIFTIGSHSVDVAEALDTSPFVVIADHLRRPELLTATLHRDDNLELLRALAPERPSISIGSRSGYRPTLIGPGWVAVGDTTTTLPFECDLEFGRIGLVEAQIQSGLYRSWCGLVVSRDRIRSRRGGLRGYLQAYLRARGRRDIDSLRALFTPAELARFDATGTPITEVTETLRPRDFGIGASAVVAIAALTAPSDPLMLRREPLLHAASWRSRHELLDVETLLHTPAGSSYRTESVAATEAGVLPAHTRSWYRHLSWAAVPGCDDLAALAEGRTVQPDTTIREVTR